VIYNHILNEAFQVCAERRALNSSAINKNLGKAFISKEFPQFVSMSGPN